MRLVILTGNFRGTVSYCLPLLLAQTGAEIAAVIYARNVVQKSFGYYMRKFRKTIRNGFLGAFNGVRMRNWFFVSSVGGIPFRALDEVTRQLKVPFFTVPNTNSQETVDILSRAKVDLGLSLGNGYIKPHVFTIPRLGMLNIHGEQLPEFRNAQSVIWQLHEGSAQSAYTIHQVEATIDGGDILKAEKVPICFRPTLSETVTVTCAQILSRAAQGLIEIINDYGGHAVARRPQSHGRSFTTPSFSEFWRIEKNFTRLRDMATQSHP